MLIVFVSTFFFCNLRVFIKEETQSEEYATLKSKDTQFATVKLPKYLEAPHNTYDRSTKTSRMQHRNSTNSRDGPAARMTRVRAATKNAST